MPDPNETIQIRLVARAEMGDIPKVTSDLQKVDAGAAKVTESLKKVEQQANRTNEALRRSSQPFAGLASPPTRSTLTSPEALRAAERAAGLRTENSMRAEDREAALQQARIDAVKNSGRAFNFRTPTKDDPIIPGADSGSEGKAERLNGVVGKLVRTFIGYAAALRTVRAAIRDYVEDERAQASLDQALAQRSQLTDQYRASLQNLANTLSNRTAIQGSTWMEVLGSLTKAGADSSNIEKTAKAVEDLAGATGQSLPEAAAAVSKALGGNFSAFTRYGFQIEQTATQTEKLNSLFEQLAARGGGQLEARAQTLSGEFNKMRNQLGELASAMINTTSKTGVLQFWFHQVTQAASFWTAAIGSTIDRSKDLQNTLTDVAGGFEDVDEAADRSSKSIDKVTKSATEAAEALEREKKAMADQSSQEIKMIEARAKLQEAQIRASNMTPDQKRLAIASLEVQTQGRVFAAQQRADTTQIHLDQQAGLDMNRDQLKRLNELEDAKAAAEREREAQATLADARRKRDYADQLRKQLGFDNTLSGGDQLAMVKSRLSVGGAAVTDAEAQTYIAESLKQIEAAEREAKAAQQKAATVTASGNFRELKKKVDDLQKTYDALSEKYEAQQKKLDEDIAERERNRINRSKLFGIDSQTRGVNIAADIASAGASGITKSPQLDAAVAELQAQNRALITAWQLYTTAVRTGQDNLTQSIHQDIKTLQTEQQERNAALIAGWQLYAEAVRRGQKELADAILKDIRNLQSQQRYQGTKP